MIRDKQNHIRSECKNPATCPVPLHCDCVPNGWSVVNPRRMEELKAAERAVSRARELADEWASEPYAEEFTSVLAGVLIDTLQTGIDR